MYLLIKIPTYIVQAVPLKTLKVCVPIVVMSLVKNIGIGVRALKLCPPKLDLKKSYSTALPGLLSDVTVLDMTRIVAGPFCTMTLGDLGANVIKVESLDGDESRKWGPPFVPGTKDAYYFLSVNRNKKSICIDLKTQEGKDFDLFTPT